MSRMHTTGLFAAATFAALVGCNSTTPTQTSGSWPDFESDDSAVAHRIINADSGKPARGAGPAAAASGYETLPTTGNVPGVPAAPTRAASHGPAAPGFDNSSAAGGIEFVDPASARPSYTAPAAPAPRAAAPAPTRAAAPVTRAAAPTAAKPAGGKYVVKKGDTLWDISKARYGTATKWKQIAAANPGVNPDKLPVGKSIVIP